MLQLANQLADASIAPADLIPIEGGVLQAVANAIAAMNTIIETSPTIDAVQQVGRRSSWRGRAGNCLGAANCRSVR